MSEIYQKLPNTFLKQKATVCNHISGCQQFTIMRDIAPKWLFYENKMLSPKIPHLCWWEAHLPVPTLQESKSESQSCQNNNKKNTVCLTPITEEEEGSITFVRHSWIVFFLFWLSKMGLDFRKFNCVKTHCYIEMIVIPSIIFYVVWGKFPHLYEEIMIKAVEIQILNKYLCSQVALSLM